MSVPNELIERFGSPSYFRDFFRGIEYSDLNREFTKLDEATKNKQYNEQYEAARQNFLKILGRDRLIWHPSDPRDNGVEVSKIYRRDQNDFIGFMRIKPQGYHSERTVGPNTEMVFHLLFGQVIFTYRKRSFEIRKGAHRILQGRSTYSIRSCDNDTSYFVFHVSKQSPKSSVG